MQTVRDFYTRGASSSLGRGSVRLGRPVWRGTRSEGVSEEEESIRASSGFPPPSSSRSALFHSFGLRSTPFSHFKLRRTSLRRLSSFLKKRHPRVVVEGGLGWRSNPSVCVLKRLRRPGNHGAYRFPRSNPPPEENSPAARRRHIHAGVSGSAYADRGAKRASRVACVVSDFGSTQPGDSSVIVDPEHRFGQNPLSGIGGWIKRRRRGSLSVPCGRVSAPGGSLLGFAVRKAVGSHGVLFTECPAWPTSSL